CRPTTPCARCGRRSRNSAPSPARSAGEGARWHPAMTLAAPASHLLTGLAGAASLFLIAAGLSLIFGVTRIVNFAHGSFYMLGLYLAVTLVEALGRTPLGFWGAVLLAALAVGAVGGVVEMLVLRRLYAAPELLQLL